MGVGKYRSKVDSNQPEIVARFREMGCSVYPLHFVGSGFPDIIVARAGVNVLVEIKDSQKPPSARRLTDDEAEFHRTWRGWVAIVEDEADAINLVKAIVNDSRSENA